MSSEKSLGAGCCQRGPRPLTGSLAGLWLTEDRQLTSPRGEQRLRFYNLQILASFTLHYNAVELYEGTLRKSINIEENEMLIHISGLILCVICQFIYIYIFSLKRNTKQT